ncbi:MAG: hypothetical protein KJN92_00315 [Gemmatimonadetes bacterium]|nr:hypothetical protein [Gemmatimonadota bacterium]
MSETSDSSPLEKGTTEAQPAADGTLGGYLSYHNRPPAFEGEDGHPYTVSVEVEKVPDLTSPFSGYLVFPRWADTGAGIVGHLETPLLFHGTTREGVIEQLEALTLLEVNDLLRQAIQRARQETD